MAQTTGRRLLSVLITDIVQSTERAAALGDRRWRLLLEAHDAAGRQLVTTASGGKWLNSTGDGFIASFDNPGEAVAVGLRFIAMAKRDLDLDIRAGVHTGETEVRKGDVAGMAVHVAARVASLAAPGELLVSRTVRDLVVGSDLTMSAAGTKTLKGIPGRWALYRVRDAASGDADGDAGGDVEMVKAPQQRRPVASQPTSVLKDTKRPSILLVDDHPLWRSTLRTVIEQGRVGVVVAEASDGPDALALAHQHHPDVVMMDVQLPTMSGIEATSAITAQLPDVRILVLSSDNEPKTVLEAVRAGASGYLLKTASAGEIRAALLRTMAGELAFPAELSRVVLGGLRQDRDGGINGAGLGLSDREREVLELMSQGLSNNAIGERLFLSPKTIETHLTAIFTKMDIPPTTDVNRRVKAVIAYLDTVVPQGIPEARR